MTKPPSPRPLSIKILAVLYLVGVPVSILMGSLAKPGIIFGITVHGWIGTLSNLCLVGLSLYLGFGLWRLQEMARKIAIWWQVYALANLWLYLFLFLAQLDTSAVNENTRRGMTSALTGSTISAVTITWFLIKRKSAFTKSLRLPK